MDKSIRNKPLSLLYCDYIELLKSGKNGIAKVCLENILSVQSNILTEKQLRIISLGHRIYGAKMFMVDSCSWSNLKDKVLSNACIHILFINDVGFNAGAGIGMARQAQSFLKAGNDVSLICGRDDANLTKAHAERYLGNIRHSISVGSILNNNTIPRHIKAQYIFEIACELKPDIVITGNFHSFAMPSEIIKKLHNVHIPIFVYAHDCDWITGGCAHPLYHNCKNHLTSCTANNCPKDKESYPPLFDTTISDNWQERSDLFAKQYVPIVTNSYWSLEQHTERFGKQAHNELIHLGIDTDIFHPLDKRSCKKILGIPESNHLIVAGSGFFRTRGKGESVLKQIFEHYRNCLDVTVGYFGGTASGDIPANVHSLGYIRDEEKMATIFSAADVFVNPVTIESFGQTMLEAASCGCPIISYATCGCTDISINNLTGLHANQDDDMDVIRCIDELLSNKLLRNRLGTNGVIISRHHFSLSQQASNWRKLLLDLALKRQWVDSTTPQSHQYPVIFRDWSLPNNRPNRKGSVSHANRISIITVVYNCGTEFHRTAQTIINQTYSNIEWIVIDGKSSSLEFLNILEFYRPFIDILVSELDGGIYDAMEKGANLASGLWTIYLGSGDYFAGRTAIEDAMAGVDETIDLVIGNVIEERLDGTLSQTSVMPVKEKISALENDCYDGPWMKGLPPHQSTFMKTKLIRQFGFDKKFKISADWDLIFKVANQTDVIEITIDKVVAYYPNGGFSANNSVKWVLEVRQICLKYCKSIAKLDQYFDKIIAHHEKVTGIRTKESAVLESYYDATGRTENV